MNTPETAVQPTTLGDDKVESSGSRDYAAWLRSLGTPLFEAGGMDWIAYHKVLVPATTAPCYIKLSADEARNVLRKSGAWMLRYSSEPCNQQTEWWYIICDRFDPQTFTHKTRQKINRGIRDCRVTRVEPEWLADHGYPCYVAAHSRYKGAAPAAEAAWRSNVLSSIGGPVEYWAVFVQEALAGYCKCIIEGKNATTTSGKYDPAYFKHRPVNALTSVLGTHYVKDKGWTLCNGNRSISHDTNMQDFLLDHGFRQQFCRLNVVYRRWVGAALVLLFPLRRLVRRLPQSGSIAQLSSLLLQEEIRRACKVTS